MDRKWENIEDNKMKGSRFELNPNCCSKDLALVRFVPPQRGELQRRPTALCQRQESVEINGDI